MMNNGNKPTDIKQQLDVLCEIFEVVRLVDPVGKIVHFVNDSIGSLDSPVPGSGHCYSLWQHDGFCVNCIAMRALNQRKTCTKIEHIGTEIYLVLAIPIQVAAKSIVIECLKNISDEGVLAVSGLGTTQIDQLIAGNNLAVVKDEATGFYKEHYIEERLQVDLAKAHQEKQPISLALLKFDNLAEVNEVCGFQAGNHALQKIARLIDSRTKPFGGWAARVTGSEFLLVLPRAEKRELEKFCFKLKKEIRSQEFVFQADNPAVMVCFGLKTIFNEVPTLDEIIRETRDNLKYCKIAIRGLPENSDLETLRKSLLTEREKQVAQLLLDGCQNQHIAEKLCVGLSTVKKYVSNILKKANVQSKSEFIARFST